MCRIGSVNDDRLRPYSAQYWKERQRQYYAQHQRRREFRRVVFLAVFLVAAVIAAAIIYWKDPGNLDDRIIQSGKEWLHEN